MGDRARLRKLADYIAATRNEIAVDEMYLAIAEKIPESVGYFPRVPRWINLATRYPRLTRLASYVAKKLWFSGGAAIFFFTEYIRFFYFRPTLSSIAVPDRNGAVLAFSTRTFDVLQPKKFPSFPKTWVTFPWSSNRVLPENSYELPMLSILNRKDFMIAYWDAITISYLIRRNRHLSVWALQAYTAFRWFLVRRAIDRLEGDLITTEHFDRWAVLMDRSVRERRRLSTCNARLVMVQHGVLSALNQEAVFDTMIENLPTRLTQVDELNAYNINEATIFKSHVIPRKNTKRLLDLKFFQPVIELTEERKSEKIRVLFVGHPLCELFHVSVYRELIKGGDYEIYYKPHPKAPMSPSLTGLGWRIVPDEKIFPRVDFLISYPSTLVVEYAEAGVPASVHPLNSGVDFLPSYIEETRGIIGGFGHKFQ